MDIGMWIALGSVATAIVVIINVYLIFFQPWWKRPKFLIEFEMKRPFCRETMTKVFTSEDGHTATYWLRLRVKNSGKSVARRCLGRLIAIMDSEDKIISDFDPMHLHWVNTDWHAIPFLPIDLSKDEYEYVDTLVTQTGDDKIHLCGDQFEWASYSKRGIRNSLEPGKYVIHVTIYGDNVKPKPKYLSLAWGGGDSRDVSMEIHDSRKKANGWIHNKLLASAPAKG